MLLVHAPLSYLERGALQGYASVENRGLEHPARLTRDVRGHIYSYMMDTYIITEPEYAETLPQT
jgi:hypothetical protein